MRNLSELIELLVMLALWLVNLAFGTIIWAIIGLFMIVPFAVLTLVVKYVLG